MGTKVIEVPEEILDLLRASRLKEHSEADQVKRTGLGNRPRGAAIDSQSPLAYGRRLGRSRRSALQPPQCAGRRQGLSGASRAALVGSTGSPGLSRRIRV